MGDHEIKGRWVTGDSASRLSSVLGLPFHPDMQDWEHQCADTHRLGEFLDLYEGGGLSDDDRFALMALIVSSFDDWLQAGGADDVLIQRVRRHLVGDFGLHERTIHYWSLLEESDGDNI